MPITDVKILIVDDVFTMRKVIKRILAQLGFTSLDEAENGKIAWDKILKAYEEGESYNLIISDLNMPEVSGRDLLQNMRNNDNFKTTPFLMITSESEQNTIVEVINSGVTDFIIKPFSQGTLKEKIQHLLNI